MGEDEKGNILGVNEVKDKRVWRAFLAEFIGTFIVVFIGTATVEVVGDTFDVARITRIAFAFGFAIASVLKALCHVSGGHINPAVTVSFLISGDIRIIKACIYIVLQCLGGILASGLLKLITPKSGVGNLGVTLVSSRIKPINGMIMEMILTFMVVLLIHGLYDPGRYLEIKGSTPLAIGIAIIASHMAGITWTGCGINPARTLGPAVFMNKYDDIWVYFGGPFIGAILAGTFYRFVLKKPIEE